MSQEAVHGQHDEEVDGRTDQQEPSVDAEPLTQRTNREDVHMDESRPPFPPFTLETATQKVRMAEDAWNTRDAPVEPAHGRGDAGCPRHLGDARDDPAMGPQIRPGIRQPHPSASASPWRQMAPR